MAILSPVLDLVFPRMCGGCGCGMGAQAGHLCWECRASFVPATAPFCERCGDPIDGLSEDSFICSFCRRREPCFDLARSAYRHRGALQQALLSYKYRGQVALANDLGEILAACVSAHYAHVRFDVVTAVPLHASRKRHRTYNQSHILAQHLMQASGMSGRVWEGIVRHRKTPSQTGLNMSQRATNVRGAFGLSDAAWVRGRTFLLVDDVMTTGATVAECSKVLKDAGAAAVYVVTVARG